MTLHGRSFWFRPHALRGLASGEPDYFLSGMMVLAPILLYPVSRLVWLAFDLTLRPPTPNDLETSADPR